MAVPQRSADVAPAANYRAEGLICAVRTCSSAIHDLLALHPRANAIRELMQDKHVRPLSGLALADLLWAELVERERAALGKRAETFLETERGTAPQFWHR